LVQAVAAVLVVEIMAAAVEVAVRLVKMIL